MSKKQNQKCLNVTHANVTTDHNIYCHYRPQHPMSVEPTTLNVTRDDNMSVEATTLNVTKDDNMSVEATTLNVTKDNNTQCQ